MEALPNMNIVDALAVLLLVIGVILGFRRGLADQLASLIGVVIVAVGAYHAYQPLGNFLAANTSLSSQWSRVLAVVLLMLASMLVMALIHATFGNLMKVVFAGWLDRLGGAVAGLVKAAALVLLIFIIMNAVPAPRLNRWFGEESLIGRQVLKREVGWTERLSRKIDQTRDALKRAPREQMEKRESAQP